MKAFWKAHRREIIVSFAVAIVLLAADIVSRPYFAVGGGGMVMVGVITYWICRFVEGGEK